MELPELGVQKAIETTNYYWYPYRVRDIEDMECLHIGKYSYEYIFNFRVHESLMLNSASAYREFLKKGFIYNESSTIIPYNEFWQIVENSKNEINGHKPYGLREDQGNLVEGKFEGDYIDEGFTFSTYLFQ